MLLVLAVLFVPWATQVQAEEDPYLITENSIGPLRLGMDEGEALVIADRIFGTDHGRVEFGYSAVFSWLSRVSGLETWFAAALQVCRRLPDYKQCRDKVILIGLITQYDLETGPAINALLARYHTREGISLGDPLSKVIVAYGKPNFQGPGFQAGHGLGRTTVLTWRKPRFRVESYMEVVSSITVFDPKTYWPWMGSTK